MNLNKDKTPNAITPGGEVMSGVNGSDANGATADELIWKVLVFDKFGQDIISSVLRVNDLFQVCASWFFEHGK